MGVLRLEVLRKKVMGGTRLVTMPHNKDPYSVTMLYKGVGG